jgi:hypothetical protein
MAGEQFPHFFTISVSTSGSKLSILDAPPPIIDNLGHQLRAYFHRLIEVDRTTSDGETRIQIGRGSASGEFHSAVALHTPLCRKLIYFSRLQATDSDKLRFSTHVLGFLNSVGFKLDGSIPMGKAGPLGFGSRKELWIFRSMPTQRSTSALGRPREGSMNGQYRDGSAHGHSSMHDHDDPYMK